MTDHTDPMTVQIHDFQDAQPEAPTQVLEKIRRHGFQVVTNAVI